MIKKIFNGMTAIGKNGACMLFFAALLLPVIMSCHATGVKSSPAPEVKQAKEIKEEKALRPPAEIKQIKPANKEAMKGPGGKEMIDLAQKKNPYADAEIKVEVIPADNKTFGYKILVNGKTFMHLVHQSTIPGMPGNKGFDTEEDARKVAELVAKKIRQNEVPPTVTREDLKRLGVLKE